MAVEARHLNLFPLRHLANREMMNTMQAGSTNMYNANATTTAHMGYGLLPLSGTTTAMTEALHHPSVAASAAAMYSSMITDSIPPHNKTPIKSESGLTYNYLPAPAVTRKRPRENSIINPILSSLPSSYPAPQANKTCTSTATVAAAAPFSFLGLDLSLQIQQEQLDIDRLVSQHMDKVRIEIEEKRKRQARRIIEGIEEGMMKRLRAKEEEIERIGKLNWALEEKVKSLCIESQIWRDLAQSNEATANALRTNLEQVLAAAAQVKDERNRFDEATALTDDAQSCCGSTDGGGVGGGGGGAAGGLEEEEGCSFAAGYNTGFAQDQRSSSNGGNRRLCRNCRKEEASVLLLPCRHLCLCTNCGSSLHTCPICKANKNASVHVNMS